MPSFVDSDHATCLNTRRSTSGGAVLLRGGAISLFSRTQATTGEGTLEVEYVVILEIAKEALFLRQKQACILSARESDPADIVQDNQGAIKMANNRYSSKRTKYINIKYHPIRDTVDEGIVRVTYVNAKDQHADMLTKPLDRRMF